MTKRKRKIKLNKGLISGIIDGEEILVKFNVLERDLQFNFSNTLMKARIEKDSCIGTFTKVNKLEEDLSGVLLFTGFKSVLKKLVQSSNVKFENAIFMIDGYVYSLVIIQNGFLLHMEIMPGMVVSFGILHQDDNILLAYQDGEWDVKNHNQDIIDICRDYFQALESVLQRTDEVYLEIIKDYSERLLIN